MPAAVVLGHAGFTRAWRRRLERSTRARWCSPPPTWAATPPASGGCSATGPRRRPGIGYAMENRRVISRVLPELYREAGLHRMEPYFWALRSALHPVRRRRPGRPAGRRALPGHGSRDRLRPGLPRLDARLPAGPGQRPGGARRLGLPERASGGLGAGRRDPAPRRRGLERPAGAARRLPARRRRPGRGGTPRPGPGRQRPRRRGAGEPRRCCPTCRPLARRCWASRCGCRRCPTWWCGDPDGARREVLERPPRRRWCVRTPRRRPSTSSPRAAPRSCAPGCWPRRTATSARSGCRSPRRPTWPGGVAGARSALSRGRSRCAPSRCATARPTARWSAAWPACSTASRRPAAAGEQGRLGAQGGPDRRPTRGSPRCCR